MKGTTVGLALISAVILAATAASAIPAGRAGQRTAYPLRLGVCDWTIGKAGDPASLELAADLMLDGVQVSLVPKGQTLALADPGLRLEFMKAARRARIPIASFAIGDLNDVPLKSDPRAEEWLSKGIDVAAAMNVKIILVPFFGKGDLRNDPAGVDAAVAALKRLAPRAEARGIILALESYLSAGEHLEILERVGSPAVRIYYDVANSQDAGHPILDEIRELGDRIVEVHAKDTKDLYGKGSIDFPAVRKALEDIGFDGWLVIEGTKMPLGVEESVRYDADFLRGVFGRQPSGSDGFQDLSRHPDAVSVITEDGTFELARSGETWRTSGLEVVTAVRDGQLVFELAAPEAAVKYIVARWNAGPPAGWKYLGDAWERSYGELEWQPLDAGREMPWYFLASDGRTTHGYGVMTQPGAMCAWKAGTDGITLTADVRCGGAGVRLGTRRLAVCRVTSRRGTSGETPFEAARAFCRQMCPAPRLPKEPVFGFNDWYCDYGRNTAASVLYYAAWISRLAPAGANRPFMVVDDGWQATGGGTGHGGPWDRGNANFPSMSELAAGIRKAGAKPGIWIHLLTAQDGQPETWRLTHHPEILDISVPEVRRYVRETVTRLRDWGYELIKHDYSVSDLAGYTRAAPGPDAAWSYADRSRTAAEIVLDHYRSIREAAGDGAVIIGCNTIGHLAAGLFELQRIGDDTSGRDWNRVRNRGVNTLGFRAPQHGAFFAVDADCVGLTEAEAIPWACNAQWLDLLARSGTPLFISFKKGALTSAQEKTVAEALALAAKPQPLAEPLDWFDAVNPTRGLEAISHLEGGAAPRRWRLMGQIVEYDWSCQGPR